VLRDLASRLREVRTQAGLTGRGLSTLCGWHSSKVSRIEHGSQTPTVEDIRAWCRCCAVADLSDELVATLNNAEGLFLEWRRLERLGLRPLAQNFNAHWERSSQVRVYAVSRIPGGLQTADYVRTVLRAVNAKRPGPVDDIEQAVLLRVERQQLLYDASRTFAYILEENALRARFGSDDVLAAQLGHLLVLSSLPNVSLGVIPADARRTALWPAETFYVFDEDHVGIELLTGRLTIRHKREITEYLRAFAQLGQMAVYGAPARRLVTAAIDALDP
jgi:transcriptional regulator with XRE-family HTH domain